MEKEIINIIFNKLYDYKITKLYKEEVTEFKIPPHINIDKIPFNILYDFEEEFFEKYKYILLENSFIYSCLIEDKEFKKHFISSIDILKNNIDDIFFKLKICEYGIKHTFNKTFNNELNETEIRNTYNYIFEKLNTYNTKISTINNLFREIILNYLQNFKENTEIILDEILTTNKHDENIIIASDEILDKEKIIYFKKFICKLILTDNFIYLINSLENNYTEYDYKIIPKTIIPNNKNNYSNIKYKNNYNYEDYEEEYEDYEDNYEEEKIIYEINTKVLKYIKNCIKTNKYYLPKDNEIRYNLFSNFLIYNTYNNDRQKDIKNISNNKENIKELKKLNPIYFLD